MAYCMRVRVRGAWQHMNVNWWVLCVFRQGTINAIAVAAFFFFISRAKVQLCAVGHSRHLAGALTSLYPTLAVPPPCSR